MDRAEIDRRVRTTLRQAGASDAHIDGYLARKADREARNVCTVCSSGLGHVTHECTGVKE